MKTIIASSSLGAKIGPYSILHNLEKNILLQIDRTIFKENRIRKKLKNVNSKKPEQKSSILLSLKQNECPQVRKGGFSFTYNNTRHLIRHLINTVDV